MILIRLFLNLPWTLLGLFGALLSGPKAVRFAKRPPAIIVRVRSFWWLRRLPGYQGVRAAAWGNAIAEGPHLLKHDDAHELVHVEQAMRRPFLHPVLYLVESLRHGHKNNRYEREAYQRAGNKYVD